MSFKPSIVNSKGDDDMLIDFSKASLRKFIRLLIGDADCQMNTAMLFKSPIDHFHISLIPMEESKLPYQQGTTPEGHVMRNFYQ